MELSTSSANLSGSYATQSWHAPGLAVPSSTSQKSNSRKRKARPEVGERYHASESCPQCGKGHLTRKWSGRGKISFLACDMFSNGHGCKFTWSKPAPRRVLANGNYYERCVTAADQGFFFFFNVTVYKLFLLVKWYFSNCRLMYYFIFYIRIENSVSSKKFYSWRQRDYYPKQAAFKGMVDACPREDRESKFITLFA